MNRDLIFETAYSGNQRGKGNAVSQFKSSVIPAYRNDFAGTGDHRTRVGASWTGETESESRRRIA
jgi:hypothetical protein